MTPDWEELLSRLLDGEDLAEDEAAALEEALSDSSTREEAREWLRFEHGLREHLSGSQDSEIALSRERLIAKVVLREKGKVTGRPAATRPRKWRAFSAVAALLLAVAAGWLLRENQPTYPRPQAEGAVQVDRLGEARAALSPERFDRLTAGDGGGVVTLGGYSRIELAPSSVLVISGQPYEESVQLVRGRATCRVEPGHGQFSVQTIHGRIDVKGTEFVTEVVNPEFPEGGEEMSLEKLKLSTVVTVAVVSGAVVCHFGEGLITLGPGQDCVYAGESEGKTAKGVVVSAGGGILKLKSGTKTATLRVLRKSKLARLEVSQLNPGDVVTVTWIEDGGEKFVTDVAGKGTVVGTVVEVGEAVIVVKPEGGKAQRFRPPWTGGMPRQGGGFDRIVLGKIRKQKEGSKVKLTWDLIEGKRVVDIKSAK